MPYGHDEHTFDVMLSLSINPAKTPKGSMRVLTCAELMQIGPEFWEWATNPTNDPTIVYPLDTQYKKNSGCALRNMHNGELKRHHSIFFEDKKLPYFHNLHHSLPWIWEGQVAVILEGPKDARVLHGCGIPAVAYLGSVPRPAQLDVLRRYASVLVWLPDKDPPEPRVEKRKKSFREACAKKQVSLYEMNLPCKDAALIPSTYPQYLKDLREILKATRRNGYVG